MVICKGKWGRCLECGARTVKHGGRPPNKYCSAACNPLNHTYDKAPRQKVEHPNETIDKLQIRIRELEERLKRK